MTNNSAQPASCVAENGLQRTPAAPCGTTASAVETAPATERSMRMDYFLKFSVRKECPDERTRTVPDLR